MFINTLDARRPLHPQLWQSKSLHTLTNVPWALWILMDFWLISFLTSFQTGSAKCRRRMSFWLDHHEIPSYLVPEEEKKSLSWKNSGINHTDKGCSHPLIRRRSEQNNGMTMGFPWWESRTPHTTCVTTGRLLSPAALQFPYFKWAYVVLLTGHDCRSVCCEA